MIVQAVKWVGGIDGYLELVDQRRLPGEFVSIECRDTRVLFDAIKTLAVRGAPAIGVAAAYGLVLALQEPAAGDSTEKALAELAKARKYLASSRPTAVNLFWALDRVCRRAEEVSLAVSRASRPRSEGRMPSTRRGQDGRDTACPRFEGGTPPTRQSLREAVLAEANAIHAEDVEMCRQIGLHGERFITDGAGILTHCNAGALATAGQGTALSPMFEAHKKGRRFSVYADETRPLLQGARLTAWELKQAGIEVAVICDNMAGWLMKQGKISAVITGADRIAANGDAANKIGTYGLSILAREHGVPFYIAAPSSTFDLSLKSGAEIPIEQRSADEVTTFAGTQTVPAGVDVWNPAFDVTDARNITAIITEKGVIKKPTTKKILAWLGPQKNRH